MKNVVILLCIISALVGSVFSHRCMSGVAYNSTTCNVSEIECLAAGCMTVCQYFYVDGKIFKSIYKGCANESICGLQGSGFHERVIFRFNANCCTGNLCNTDGYDLPKDDPTPNGKLCPSAFCPDTVEECKGHHMVECTGAMDRCFEYRAEAIVFGGISKKYSVKGCINEAACKVNFDGCIAITEIKRNLLTCDVPPIKLSDLMNKPSIY
ncbi:phospholipase A2 inhibitor and Ly6/PLAUR domain-containing protein-like [Dendrobates tinctorius]|uniref:phospholipase A2 inhibitor and Ly6/PLAUR domain-containing protein-like n=1 Tax=Dendrobates tinctorius TaxID=92724 RepID=UPI003CC97DF4